MKIHAKNQIQIDSNIISNDKSNLSDTNKRRMQVLSFYKFRERINIISKKYKSNVKLINEYMTSKMCHNCENIYINLGSKIILHMLFP